MSDDKNKDLGDKGEEIVTVFFTGKGHKAVPSPDRYDSNKDLVIDDRIMIEVKTQRPWHTQDAFSVRADQIRKCSNIDWNYFVSVAHADPRYLHPSAGNIYKITGEKFNRNFYLYRASDGRDMVLIKIKHCELVTTVSKEDYEILKELANR
jgi:hypothetical protein